jgi:protein-L-isoaspartate(D-aspartate) O-methyltransferase
MTIRRRAGEGPADLVTAARRAGVRDPRVLAVLAAVPRAAYLPVEGATRAGEDEPITIPHGQVTTQPSLIAVMLEALALKGDVAVLGIGTGYGFQTALLAGLARCMWSVERFPVLAETAQANLDAQRVTNAHVQVGNGTLGLAEYAPFDAVLVSAAFRSLPPPLVEQWVIGALLVQPVGPGGHEEVMPFMREPKGLVTRRAVTGARFVRLVGSHGFGDEREERRDG